MVAIVAIVLIVIIAVLYVNSTKAMDDQLKIKQASYDSLNNSYQGLMSDYTKLVGNNSQIMSRYMALDVNYKNVSRLYQDLLSKSSAVDARLTEFMENGTAVAYTYRLANISAGGNVTGKNLTVIAYNVGTPDIEKLEITATLRSDNVTRIEKREYLLVRSLDKRTATWELDNGTEVLDVWAGPA